MTSDPWQNLRLHTAARIALGRAGASLPTAELLRFSLDHAMARDAVHTKFDLDQLEYDLPAYPMLRLTTQASDRQTYLQRPDLGRQLSPESAALLTTHHSDYDLSIILADGLSATATQLHAPQLLLHLLPKIASFKLAPLTLVTHARVALEDQIGQLLGARAALILLGERPGLTSPYSLGAYLIFNPNPDNTDANRNCVSNIRPQGLPIPAAADTLAFLLHESLRLKLSGVELKDTRPSVPKLT